MKSLCLFVCYTENDHADDLPLIGELQNHFDEVIVLTNLQPKRDTFKYLLLQNKGYDFGFFYQALQKLDLSAVDFLGLVNNSQVLLPQQSLGGFFEWCNAAQSTFCGVTDSFETPSGLSPEKSYHLQSFFLVLKGSAVPLLKVFFDQVRFERFFEIKNLKKLRQTIINDCEVGLSQFMLQQGQRVSSWFSANKFNLEHRRPVETNMHVMLWEELILAGYPLMKKKIVSGAWDRFIPNPSRKHLYLKGYYGSDEGSNKTNRPGNVSRWLANIKRFFKGL